MTPTRRSPPIATCSTTRRRPRRWAPAPANVCSTSTRMRTVPGNCWLSPVSRCPLQPMAEPRRIAIVPARNEKGAIGDVVREIRDFDPGLDVLVIDDGSTDETAELAAAAGAIVLRLPFNLGIGG